MPARRRLLPLALTVAALIAAALPAAAAAATCAGADVIPSAGKVRSARGAVLCLINRERAKRGRVRVKADARLGAAAERHSRNMRIKGFFDHVSPAGVTDVMRVRSAGYLRNARGWAVGENIGWGTDELATPRAMVRAWMRSDGHRFNILHPRFRDIGIGISLGTPEGGDGAIYTTNFGTRG